MEAAGRGFSEIDDPGANVGEGALTRYMLDTKHHFRPDQNPQGKAAKRVAKVGEDNICTSIIGRPSCVTDAAKSGSKRLLKAVEDLSANQRAAVSMFPLIAEYVRKFRSDSKRPESRSAATTC